MPTHNSALYPFAKLTSVSRRKLKAHRALCTALSNETTRASSCVVEFTLAFPWSEIKHGDQVALDLNHKLQRFKQHNSSDPIYVQPNQPDEFTAPRTPGISSFTAPPQSCKVRNLRKQPLGDNKDCSLFDNASVQHSFLAFHLPSDGRTDEARRLLDELRDRGAQFHVILKLDASDTENAGCHRPIHPRRLPENGRTPPQSIDNARGFDALTLRSPPSKELRRTDTSVNLIYSVKYCIFISTWLYYSTTTFQSYWKKAYHRATLTQKNEPQKQKQNSKIQTFNLWIALFHVFILLWPLFLLYLSQENEQNTTR